MVTYRYSLVAREGWWLILLTTLTALLVQLYLDARIAVVLWLVSAALLFLFRDPFRRVPSLPLAVISPVDGRVVEVATVKTAYFDGEVTRISIEMNGLGVFSVRSPIEGKVMRQWTPGSRREGQPITRDFAQWTQSDEGDDVVLAIKRPRFARWLVCYAQSGERIGQGQRCGYVPFGATIDVLLPLKSRAAVKPGEKVLSGVTVLAKLVHP